MYDLHHCMFFIIVWSTYYVILLYIAGSNILRIINRISILLIINRSYTLIKKKKKKKIIFFIFIYAVNTDKDYSILIFFFFSFFVCFCECISFDPSFFCSSFCCSSFLFLLLLLVVSLNIKFFQKIKKNPIQLYAVLGFRSKNSVCNEQRECKKTIIFYYSVYWPSFTCWDFRFGITNLLVFFLLLFSINIVNNVLFVEQCILKKRRSFNILKSASYYVVSTMSFLLCSSNYVVLTMNFLLCSSNYVVPTMNFLLWSSNYVVPTMNFLLWTS